jgi:hypothetical protein
MRKVIDLNKPEDKAMVRAHAARPEIGLVVIDSLGGSLMDENDSSAKKVLQELSRMAQETETTLLIIHHLRKQQKYSKGHQPPSLSDVRGHSGITQFAPSVIAIDYEGHEMPRFLYPLKMNLVEAPATMTFSMGTMGLIWNESTHDQVHRAVVQEAANWLEEMLLAGPMLVKEALELANDAGYNKDIIREAIGYPTIKMIKNHHDERCLSL